MASSARRKGKVIRTPGSVLVRSAAPSKSKPQQPRCGHVTQAHAVLTSVPLCACSAAPPAAAHAPRYPSFLVAGSPAVPIANSPSKAIVAASSQQPFLAANAVHVKLLDDPLSQASPTKPVEIPTSCCALHEQHVTRKLCGAAPNPFLARTCPQQAQQHTLSCSPKSGASKAGC